MRQAQRLLRGHVVRRAQRNAAAGQPRPIIQAPGQPEVRDLGGAVGGQEDVTRLQVAVDDPAVVGRLDGLSQRGDERRGPAGGEGSDRKPLGETSPFDELHREVRSPVVVADVVDLHDVGVSQARGGLGLALESLPFVGSGKVAGQQHLDGDRAVKALIPRPVHNTHAAPAQLVLHFVAAEMRRLGGPRPGRRHARIRAGATREAGRRAWPRAAHVSQARLDLGQQLRIALAHLLGALARVEDYLEEVLQVAFAGQRWNLRPGVAGGHRRRYTQHAHHHQTKAWRVDIHLESERRVAFHECRTDHRRRPALSRRTGRGYARRAHHPGAGGPVGASTATGLCQPSIPGLPTFDATPAQPGA